MPTGVTSGEMSAALDEVVRRKAPSIPEKKEPKFSKPRKAAIIGLAAVSGFFAGKAVGEHKGDEQGPAKDGVVEHVVQEGEGSMWEISGNAGVEGDPRKVVDEMVELNGGSSEIREGQVVKLPASAVTNETFTTLPPAPEQPEQSEQK